MQHGQKLMLQMLQMHMEGTKDGSAQSTFHIYDQVGPIMLSGVIADKLSLSERPRWRIAPGLIVRPILFRVVWCAP